MSSGWTRGDLVIARTALHEVERAAREAYARNQEACGYLEGPAADERLADRAVVLENLADRYHQVDPENHPRTGREYFKINALQFERAIAEGAERGRPVKVFFHSHLDCGAYFSDEDARSMTLGGGSSPAYELAYLVTAIDAGEVTAHRLFVWDEAARGFREARFSVPEAR